MGRAAVCGVGELVVARDHRSATLAGRELAEGDLISVDGDRGVVSAGRRPTVAADTDPNLARFLRWKEGER
jgi:pyruvate,orthophosphate dikinase